MESFLYFERTSSLVYIAPHPISVPAFHLLVLRTRTIRITFGLQENSTLMKSLLFAILFLCLTCCASAQSSSYFQQEVNYKINVTLNDKEHSLSAFEEFEYVNNSNQQLDYLIVHLWPNAYKNAKTAMSKQKFAQGDFFMLWADQNAKGFIDSLDFKVDGEVARWEHLKEYEDIAVIYLNSPLPSGGRIKVSTPFYVKLPSGSISRLGHIGESYQITQWFPKPAVYDMEGWHEMPYLTQGEFFSEFGSFDVSITLPSNYIVGATGDLQTSSEISFLNELAQKTIPAFSKEKDLDFPTSSASSKTIRYTQKNVHDFGWFADKRWVVRKGEVELPHSKRKVTTWAMFTPQNSETWSKAGIKAINDGLYYYSLWTGDYPYDVCTAVDGTISAGGGMEYPNVTVIGDAGSESALATVIIHEVGHNWFYGILGSNERDNAWMDEGINSFFETRTILATNKNPNALDITANGLDLRKILNLNKFSYQFLTEELPYLVSARGYKDQPIQAPSEYYTGLNYGTIVYKKTALAFNYLMNSLGETKFNECMAAYYEAWKFKHPSPTDLRFIFEKTSGKNLSWFFEDLVYTKSHVDYKMSAVKMHGDSALVTVKNDGEIAAPYSIDVLREGKLIDRIWIDGIPALELQTTRIAAQKGDVLKVNNVQGIPEFNRNNNTIRTAGAFKKVEPYTLRPIIGVDDPETSQLFWTPLVAWNEYNKWMLGVQLHNQTFPEKNFKWSLAPLFSFNTTTINGFAKIEYDNGKIGIGIRGQRFGESTFPYNEKKYTRSYHVISPYIRAMLFPDRLQKDWSGNVDVSLFSIGELLKSDDSKFVGDYSQIYPVYGDGPQLSHLRLRVELARKFPRSEFRFNSSFEGGEYTDWSVFHQHALSYDFVYGNKAKKKIRTRLYYGGGDGFYLNAAGQYGGIRYSQDSPKNNIPGDYAFDGLFFGRNESTGFLSQQFMRTQGALAAPTQQSANKHLASLNVEIDLPIKFPLSIYSGGAILKNNKETQLQTLEFVYSPSTNDETRYLWNAGVSVPLIRNICHVYFPVIYSKNIQDEINARGLSFGETIMFELNLPMANPMELIKKIGN
jgi:hypothetical protein